MINIWFQRVKILFIITEFKPLKMSGFSRFNALIERNVEERFYLNCYNEVEL